jgi:predicted MarR family transcription regulator
MYYAVHPRWQIECMHMAVLLHNSERELRLLDPLGRPPRRRALHNVVISLDVVRGDLQVEGTFYRINPRKAFSILHWERNDAIDK